MTENILKKIVIDDLYTTVEIINPELEGNFIIFSHGFGVKRDSKRLFTDIAQSLLPNYSIVLFDYNQFDSKGNSTVPKYSDQIKIFEGVVKFIKEEYIPFKIDVIAHSMGASIVSGADTESINKLIFMAIAVKPSYERLIKYFSTLPNCNFNEFGLTTIKRANGTKTIIENDFWPELKRIDPLENILSKSEEHECFLVIATNDERITDSYEDFFKIPKLKIFTIDSDHNFEKNRSQLLEIINSVFRP